MFRNIPPVHFLTAIQVIFLQLLKYFFRFLTSCFYLFIIQKSATPKLKPRVSCFTSRVHLNRISIFARAQISCIWDFSLYQRLLSCWTKIVTKLSKATWARLVYAVRFFLYRKKAWYCPQLRKRRKERFVWTRVVARIETERMKDSFSTKHCDLLYKALSWIRAAQYLHHTSPKKLERLYAFWKQKSLT